MKSSVQIKNWNPKVIDNMVESAKGKLIMIGKAIEVDAVQNVPVDTGRLRSSISTNWSGSGKGRISPMNRFVGAITTLYNTRISMRDKESIENDGVGEPPEEEGKFTVVVGSNVFYSIYVEIGGMHPPKPFLRPAYEKYRLMLQKLGATVSFNFFEGGY